MMMSCLLLGQHAEVERSGRVICASIQKLRVGKHCCTVCECMHDELMPNVYLVMSLTRSKLPLKSMENYTCTFASLCNSGVTEY